MQREFSLSSYARQSRRWSLAQALIVSVLVLGQLLGSLHFALVQHVICPEHGELAHTASTEASTPWVARGVGGPSETVVPSRSASVQSQDDHQHCLIQAQRRDTVLRGGPSTPLIADGFNEGNHWADVPPFKSSALFRLAPKHSPPA